MYPTDSLPSFSDAHSRLRNSSTEHNYQLWDNDYYPNHGMIVDSVEPFSLNKDHLAITEHNDEFSFCSLHDRQVQPYALGNALYSAPDLSDDLRPYAEYVLWKLDNPEAPDDRATATGTTPYVQIGSEKAPLPTSNKCHKCEKCEKCFSRLSGLKAHNRTHTSEKPYSCDQCEKRFALKSYLTRHKRTHTTDKPYSCDHCEKRFRLKHYLTKHKRTHTGEKPYQCDQCNKAFAHNFHLKKHKHTHSGENPCSY